MSAAGTASLYIRQFMVSSLEARIGCVTTEKYIFLMEKHLLGNCFYHGHFCQFTFSDFALWWTNNVAVGQKCANMGFCLLTRFTSFESLEKIRIFMPLENF